VILGIIDNAFLSIVAAAIPASTVVVLAATGAMVNEKVGVLNLGQEGLIGIGAIFSVLAVLEWEVSSPWLCLLIGMLAAAVAGLAFALTTVVVRANQVLVGLALALGGTGLSNQLGTNRNGTPITTLFRPIDPGSAFSGNQVVEAFLYHDLIVYSAYLFLPLGLWFLFYRTRHGLNIRAVGESPATADTTGTNVLGVRVLYTVLGSAISGAAGSYMVLSFTPTWSPDIARGRGWVALAVVILAAWRPFWVVLGALLYGSMISLATTQARGWKLPFMDAIDLSFFLSMLPYLVTLIAILIPAGAAHLGRKKMATEAPAGLAVPYYREER
jgi:general nucleoside transport system permease protein